MILRYFLLILLIPTSISTIFAQWKSIGPYGVSYNTILKFDPFSPGRLFATGVNHLYRSDDAGNFWKKIIPTSGTSSGNVAISASVPGEVYTVSYENIYKSTDYGDSWTLYYTDSVRTIIYVDELDPNHFVAYESHGNYVKIIVQSTDRGAHWQTTIDGIDSTEGMIGVWVNENFPNIMFAIQWLCYGGDVCYGKKYFKTSNTGSTWEKLNFDIQNYYNNVVFDPIDSAIIYLLSDVQPWIKSTDMGNSWNMVGSGYPTKTPNQLFISQVNSNVLFVPEVIDSLEQTNIYISENGGSSWRIWRTLAPSQYIPSLSLDIHNPGDLYVVSYPYGIFRTRDDGQSWTNISQGLTESHISSCAPFNERVIYAGIGSIGLEKTTDGGQSWQILIHDRSSEAGKVLSSRTDPEIVYTNCYINGGGLSISKDGGISWQTLRDSASDFSFSEFDVGPDDLTIYGSTIDLPEYGNVISGLVKSTDGGQNWITLGLGIDDVNNIEKIYIDPVNAGTLYLLVWILGASDRNIILKSSDGGGYWEDLADSVAYYFLNLHNPNFIYYTNTSWVNPGSFISGNGGGTFQRIASDMRIRDLCADPNVDGKVYAINQNGVLFYSEDYGYTWELFTEGNPPGGLNTIHVAITEDSAVTLFVTTGTEILTHRISGSNSIDPSVKTAVKKYNLSQNHPNPFNPSTQITFSVPKATDVTLKVYDVLGREIAVLVNERKQPGEYKVSWNAEGVPSGVYFYRIVAGEFVETKKMIVVN